MRREVVTKPTLSWAPSLRAASYQYCYDTSNDDACTTWTTTSATSVTISTPLTTGATYYWQVRAVNPNTTTDADGGTWWSFTTLSVPGAFGKAVPDTGSVDQLLTMNLSWDSSSNVDHYEYCYDTINDNACTTWISTSGTTVALSGLARNTTYYWQVQAANSNGKTYADSPTSYWSFTTIPSAPAAFAKSTPANAAPNQSISLALSWAASSGAEAYEYCLDTNNNAACDTSWVNTGTGRLVNPSGLAYSTTYYWQVRAINPGGVTNANASSWWSFTTQVDPASQFTKTFPGDGYIGVVLNPTLRWNPSNGATSYKYCYDLTDDKHCDGTWKSVTSASAAISGLAAGTTYFWQVTAVNSTNTVEVEADNSNWFSFSTLPVPGAFSKVSPGNAATDQLVVDLLLNWGESSDVSYYEYCYDTTNDKTCTTWISTSDTTAALAGLALNTTYYWQVRAVNNSGKTDSNGGAWWSFKTQPPAPTAFSKSTPANNAANIALTNSLTWASAGTVENYSYCLDTNPGVTCDGIWIDMGTARHGHTGWVRIRHYLLLAGAGGELHRHDRRQHGNLVVLYYGNAAHSPHAGAGIPAKHRHDHRLHPHAGLE